MVRNGDRVVAEGILFETDVDSEALLCWGGGWIGDIGCFGNVVVPVHGVDVRELPGRETDPHVPELPARTWATFWVRVDGVWADGALEITHVDDSAAQPSFVTLYPIYEVPCDPPLRGWQRAGVLPGEGEERWAELEREVSRHPDTYSGISSAIITTRPERLVATVVGTLVDPATVDRRLRTIWSHNLCVNRVEVSAAELDEVADSVGAIDETWEVRIEYGFGRMFVRVPVFDERTADALAPYMQLIDVRSIVTSTEG